MSIRAPGLALSLVCAHKSQMKRGKMPVTVTIFPPSSTGLFSQTDSIPALLPAPLAPIRPPIAGFVNVIVLENRPTFLTTPLSLSPPPTAPKTQKRTAQESTFQKVAIRLSTYLGKTIRSHEDPVFQFIILPIHNTTN